MCLKNIDHMNRIIYIHDIIEHEPENVLSRFKTEVESYDVTFNVRNLNSAVGKITLHVVEFLHCQMFEKKIMYMDSYFVFKVPV
jgi:hypothetical protein